MNMLEKLKKGTMESKIDRRGFMNKALLTGAGVAGAVAMPSVAVAKKPKRGGVLRLGSNGASTSTTFDPALFGDNWSFLLGETIFNRLTILNNDNVIEPELATDWTPSKDGMSWVVNLRKGVEWHDGSEFTADDVTFSLNRHIGPDSKSTAKGIVESWKTVKKTGKYQVTIILKTPDYDLPYILNQTRLLIVKNGTTDWMNPIGTGAYMMTKYNPGATFEAKRNPNYFKSDAGYFDAVQYIAINDDTSRINALLSGAVDVIREVPFGLASRIEKHSKYNVVKSDVGQYLCNDMNCKKGWTKDNNARLALKYGTDRQAILDIVLDGYGSIANDQPIFKGDALYNENIPQRTFDADKAKYYWKKTGLGNTEIAFDTSSGVYAGAVKQALVLAENYKKTGINLKINKNPADGYWSDVWGKKPFVANYWGRRSTSSITFANAYGTKSSGNSVGFSDEKFDDLLIKLKKEKNNTVRKEISGKMQKIIHEKGGVGIPVFYSILDASSTKVKGLEPHGVLALNNYRIAEKGWFE